jgi:hypothetical protein
MKIRLKVGTDTMGTGCQFKKYSEVKISKTWRCADEGATKGDF